MHQQTFMSAEKAEFIENPTKYDKMMETPGSAQNGDNLRSNMPAMNQCNFNMNHEYMNPCNTEHKTNAHIFDALETIMSNQHQILDGHRQLESRLARLEEHVSAVNFVEMSQDIRQMTKSLGRLTGEHSIDENNCEISSSLPLASIHEIEALEAKLQNKENEMAMRDYILMIKGTTGTIDQVLRQVFTDEAMHHYNFEGKQSKRSFVDLRVKNIIYDVFQINGRFQIDRDIRKYIEMSHNRQKSRAWQKQQKIMENTDPSVCEQNTDSYFNNLPEPSVYNGMVIKTEENIADPENMVISHVCNCGRLDAAFGGHLEAGSNCNGFNGIFGGPVDAGVSDDFKGGFGGGGAVDHIDNDLQKEISFSLPLNSVEAIELFEGKLQNPKMLMCLKQYVARMKGDTGSINDVLRHVFKDDAISHYNFDGVQGKRSFVMLQIMQKVICCVFQNLGKPVIHRDVKRFIKMSHNRQKSKLWLRKAKKQQENMKTVSPSTFYSFNLIKIQVTIVL